MVRLLKVGIVGCGAIGSSLAKTIAQDFSQQIELAGCYDIDNRKAELLSSLVSKKRKLNCNNLARLISKSELVIEASSALASRNIAKKVLAKGRDIMVMSVGGIAGHLPELSSLAKENKARVYIPSGAISGIDSLKAAACGKINKINLTTKKPLKAFIGVPYIVKKNIKLEEIHNETVMFEGSAAEAVSAFPQNINVAATLSAAGIGSKKTTVRIIASPEISKNIHEVEIDSDAGKVFTRTENIVHPDNPKTSYLAVLSAVAVLRQILNPIKIGT